MSPKQIDYLNIGLVLVSFFLAYKLPFELFLFSYAVLGPLHYMTEIGWLNKKDYFIIRKKDYLFLAFLALLFAIGYAFATWEVFPNQYTEGLISGIKASFIGPAFSFLIDWLTNIVFIAFISALAFTFIKNNWVKAGAIVASILVAHFIKDVDPYAVGIGTFLPTVMHVCVFTGAFMLFGSLKSKSTPGLIAFGVFAICSVLFFFLKEDWNAYPTSKYVQESFIASNFGPVNSSIFEVVSSGDYSIDKGLGLNIQRFLAFIYTYHYLNWFSKTRIIQWHNVSRKWMITTAVVWVASISIYAIDFRTGFVALAFLSFLHVFLEFPLNYKSFLGIYSELRDRIGSPSS